MLLTCQTGYQDLLAREVADQGGAELARGPGWVRLQAPVGGRPDFVGLDADHPFDHKPAAIPSTHEVKPVVADPAAHFLRIVDPEVAANVAPMRVEGRLAKTPLAANLGVRQSPAFQPQ